MKARVEKELANIQHELKSVLASDHRWKLEGQRDLLLKILGRKE